MAHTGDPNVRTPWLDGLVSESIYFSQAVTPHPLGPQARAAFLTGRLCPENGVRDYWDPLPANSRTIAHALSDRGYTTGFFGKWHLGKRSRTAPLVGEIHAKTIVRQSDRGGFDFWEGFEGGFLINDPWLHGTRLPSPTLFKGYQPDVLFQRAAQWIDKCKSRPVFCLVSVETPHPPYHAPSPFFEKRRMGEIRLLPNVPRGGSVEDQAREELRGYYAHIEATDRSIGGFLANLDLSNMIVVFTSVHGDMHGAHGLFRKAWPYEESVRIPMIVRHPINRGKGIDDESMISLVDLPYMTLAWAEGHEWRSKRDNALISMPSAPGIPRQCDRAWHGFRSSKRKLILNDDGSPWLYFDLERDPYEMINLVEDRSRLEEIQRSRLLL